jgi:xanthine dehydrogenase accessory factor
VTGSVSAGCVEGAVIEESQAVLESGESRLLTYGVADEDAWEVGLTCGGTIKVFVEPLSAWDSVYDPLKQRLDNREPMAVVSVLEGPAGQIHHKLLVTKDGLTEGNLELPGQMETITRSALDFLARGKGGTLELSEDTTLFVEVYSQVSRLIIVGAVHIAEPLVALANTLEFDTIVVDPRAAFTTRERFPHATELIKQYPQRALPDLELDQASYIVTLTHDPKFDDPALQIALQSNARYVGALGSRRTNQRRLERLREAGLTDDQLARLHAPVGLPLGGRSPAEIAISIMAEIVQVKNTPSI